MICFLIVYKPSFYLNLPDHLLCKTIIIAPILNSAANFLLYRPPVLIPVENKTQVSFSTKNNAALSNQIFHYTRCITLKRATSFTEPISRHGASAAQLILNKMLQRWRGIGNTVLDLTYTKVEPQASRSSDQCVVARITGRLVVVIQRSGRCYAALSVWKSQKAFDHYFNKNELRYQWDNRS